MDVQALMMTPVQTCRVDDTLDRAAGLMWQHAVGMVAVVDEQDRPVAVLTDRDIAMAALLTGRRISEIPARQSMSRVLHTCRTTDPLRAVQAKMASVRVRRLLVLDEEGALRGVISTDDLIRASASGWRLLAAPELVRALGAVASPPSPSPDPEEDTEEEESGDADGFWEGWRRGLTQLQQRRDELRVGLHLAGREAREEWERLEGQLRRLQQRARAAEKRAEVELQRSLHELGEAYGRLRGRLASPPGE